jgi:predicted PurR-regulated permease PerM
MTDKNKIYYFTQTLAILILLGTLWQGLLPALLGGLFIYFLVEFGSRQLGRVGVIPAMGKLILLAFAALVVIAAFAAFIIGMVSFVSEGPESIVVLLQRMADIVRAGQNYLPLWAINYLPANVDEWQKMLSEGLRNNAGHLSVFGKDLGVLLVHVIFGMIIGGMVAISPAFQDLSGSLSQALSERIELLSKAFHRIVFSQIRISALNTFLTALFLSIILPLIIGRLLPMTKILVLVTFVVGLLPIVGNLISNTIIFVIALSVSPKAAICCLLFLIIIHKLEYFFNAHIIGAQIKARAWEILLAMLVMESIFGLSGLIAAPIYYAYLKDELTRQKLV